MYKSPARQPEQLRLFGFPREYVPVGTISFFFRKCRSCWLASIYWFDLFKVNYPNLYNVLPSGITTTGTSFTLPDLRGGILTFRNPIGTEPLPLVGQIMMRFHLPMELIIQQMLGQILLINALIGIVLMALLSKAAEQQFGAGIWLDSGNDTAPMIIDSNNVCYQNGRSWADSAKCSIYNGINRLM